LDVNCGTIRLRRPRVQHLKEGFESRVLPLFAKRTRKVRELISKLYPPDDYKKVLDLGCGTGRITENLVALGYDVIGCDIFPVAINKLKSRGIDGFVHNVSIPLPVEDETYDMVFCTDLLELVPDIFLFVSEIHRAMKPNGRFVFAIVHLAWWYYRVRNLFGKSSSDLMPPVTCAFPD